MVRRSLNWRFLLGTLLIGGVTGTALYLLHGWQLGRTAGGLLDRAATHEQSQEWLKAAESLDRYLAIRPGDAPAKIRLARAYGRGAKTAGQRRRAVDLHYRALGTGDVAAELELRCGLADLLVETGQAPEAQRQAQMVLERHKDNAQATRTLVLALSQQLADGSFANQSYDELKIIQTAEQARRLNPDDLRLAMLLASLLRDYPAVVQAERPTWRQERREQEANQTLDGFVREFPQSAEARLARFKYRRKYGLAGAADDLRSALELTTDNQEILYTAAVHALEQAREQARVELESPAAKALWQEAKGHFEQLIKLTAESPVPYAYLGLGEAWLGLREVDRALAAWREGVERFEQPTTRAEFHGRIADACLSHDRLVEAAAALDATDAILAKLGGSIAKETFLAVDRVQNLRRASWHLQRRTPAPAVPLLRLVLATQPAGEGSSPTSFRAWYLLGTAYSAMQDWMEAATAFDQAAALQPGVQLPQLAAANSWLLAGRADLSRERAEQAWTIAGTRDAWFAIAMAELQLQRSRPLRDRQWIRIEEAVAALEQSASQPASQPAWRIAFLKAELLVFKAQGEGAPDAGTRRAIELLRAAENEYGGDREFWRQLCFVYQEFKSDADADRAVEALRKLAPGVETSLVGARLLSLRGDVSAAKTLLQEAQNSAPPQLVEAVRAELLRVTLAARDWEQGRTLLLEAHQHNPQDLTVLRRLAELDLERNDLRGVENWEQELRSVGQAGELLARYYRAWRLYRSATKENAPELGEALAEIQQVVLAQPNWAEATTLKAMTLQRLGRWEHAVADYERAIKNGDRRALVFEQLIGLLDRLHRPAEVERHLARWEGEAPPSQWLTEFAGAQQIRNERPERALEIARQNAARRPNDSAAQLWLGRLLTLANQQEAAEISLQKAVDLAPANASAWSALLSFYGRTKDQVRLAAELARLESADDLEAAQKSLLLGQAHHALGNSRDAELNYARAASQDEDSVTTRLRVAQFYLQSAPAQAKPHLEAALRIAPDSKPARQMLAIASAATGDLTAVETLLSTIRDDAAASAEDARLHALLLVQHGGAEKIGQAAKLLEGLVARKSGVQPLDRILLARLYEQQANAASDAGGKQALLGRAERELIELSRAADANPLHLATLVQFYARLDRPLDAAASLEKLQQRVNAAGHDDPNALAVVIETQLQQKSAKSSASWLARLDKLEPAALRPAALAARVAVQLNANAEVEAIVEPRMTLCVAQAQSDKERQQLYATAGNLYRDLSRPVAAERWMRALVAEAPQQYPALVSVLVAQRKLSEAIALCEQAAAASDSPQAALVLAAALVEGEATDSEMKRAKPVLTDAAERHASNEQLLYAVALVAILQNENPAAEAMLRRVIELNPRHVPALNNLALVASEIPAQREEALRLIDKALEVAGPSAGLLDTKGTILVYSGRSAQAITLLESSIQGKDVDPRHHFHLALAYHDTGRAAEAKTQMQLALDRELGAQVLTSTDRKRLADILDALQMTKPVSTTAVSR
jgi:tetratricopeptide (TPR) repeat protein